MKLMELQQKRAALREDDDESAEVPACHQLTMK